MSSNGLVLQDVVAGNRLVFSSCAAGTMLLLFDLLIRLDDEVELIWRSSNTPPKFLYFTSRYFGLFVQLIFMVDVFPLYCPAQLYFRSAAYFVLHVSIEISLMIRIYALWGQRRTVALFLAFSWAAEQIVNVAILVVGLFVIAKHNEPYPKSWPIVGCQVTFTPYFFNFCWVPVLFYETLLFTMNAYKCFSYRPLIHTPLIVRVFRDGTLYYLLMCFVLVMRIVSQFHSGALGVNGDIVDTWMTTTFSIAGANLLLSIRKLSAEREERHLATPEFSCAIPQFASHPAVVTATSHHNYDSLSSRTCKVDLPSDSDYEMQSLAHHTHTESSFRGLVSSDKGPPKLSLDLRSSYQHSPDSERAPSLAAGEVPPVPPSAPERKASVKSSRSSRDPDYGWLQGWEAKL